MLIIAYDNKCLNVDIISLSRKHWTLNLNLKFKLRESNRELNIQCLMPAIHKLFIFNANLLTAANVSKWESKHASVLTHTHIPIQNYTKMKWVALKTD